MSQRDLVSRGRADAAPASAEMVVLSDDECWAHLRAHSLGRVTIEVDHVPHIFPVTYSVGDHDIVFRTGAGAKLTYGPGSMSCFEIDAYDQHALEGWSVMAFGRLREVTDAADERSQEIRRLPLLPVAPGRRAHWIAMRVAALSGRRFTGGWIVPGAYYG